MYAFEYANPATLQEAIGLLGEKWTDANILAGGTDLISIMKERLQHPARVVNIKNIKELGGISKTAAGLRIGATVTLDELLSNALVRAECRTLLDAARGVTSPQIRNMGTVGGDLCQRPRCWYYRNHLGFLGLTTDNKSRIVDGQNEFHAIFNNSGPAKFVSASSFGPALVSLGAMITIAGPKGTRKVEAAKFFTIPKARGEVEKDLAPNEIVTEVVIPSTRGAKSSTYEIRQKEALDWPLATASVLLAMKGSTVDKAQVVLGHVSPIPYAASDAASWLSGKSITEETATQAGEAAVKGATPLSGNAYKVQLAKVAVKRALLAAVKA